MEHKSASVAFEDYQEMLLGVDGDRWAMLLQEGIHFSVDVLKSEFNLTECQTFTLYPLRLE